MPAGCILYPPPVSRVVGTFWMLIGCVDGHWGCQIDVFRMQRDAADAKSMLGRPKLVQIVPFESKFVSIRSIRERTDIITLDLSQLFGQAFAVLENVKGLTYNNPQRTCR